MAEVINDQLKKLWLLLIQAVGIILGIVDEIGNNYIIQHMMNLKYK